MCPSNSDSHLFSLDMNFVEELYDKYLQDSNSVSAEWRDFFAKYDVSSVDFDPQLPWEGVVSSDDGGMFRSSGSVGYDTDYCKEKIIDLYRSKGHLYAVIDPINSSSMKDFDKSDFKRELDEIIAVDPSSLGAVRDELHKIYCSSVGIETGYISNKEEKEWICSQFENSKYRDISDDDRIFAYQHCVDAGMFEAFLHTKFAGAKRFSVEGGDSAIVAMEELVRYAANTGVKEVVIGMAHRGRLNAITKVAGKSYDAMIYEFKGFSAFPDDSGCLGDVKYHMGFETVRKVECSEITVRMAANPSHLESVNPVIAGVCRAKQDCFYNSDRGNSVIPLAIHGDAAVSGQGVVYETIAACKIKGYDIGGTFHIIINNQIGFTADMHDSRSTTYCSDVAKMIEAPVLHVNGNDLDAVIFAVRLAEDYRRKFRKDIFIDLVCFRRYGHNEADEPRFTQPAMYKKIDDMPPVMDSYEKELIEKKVISADFAKSYRKKFRSILDKALVNSDKFKPEITWFRGLWKDFKKDSEQFYTPPETGVDTKILKDLGKKICGLPKDFKVHRTIEKLVDKRSAAYSSGSDLDWGCGELLAYASLLSEGISVRLAGEDSRRGTFSHRQSYVYDQESNDPLCILDSSCSKGSRVEIVNSYLSEFAAMGFEYGYSLVDPRRLIIWEAQFGDFANGAQIMIDQYLCSAETKWMECSGLVLLLPHGYEGQGSEHSSARIERYLQLSAEKNWYVVNCTTPANLFHALRRQIVSDIRKPLVVFTPKSLLRHKDAVSSFVDMDKGTKFQTVIGNVTSKKSKDSDVKKVIICSGKLYYELSQYREENGLESAVALIRLEQFYPFPVKLLKTELDKYKKCTGFVWCQEEPENNGGWEFVRPLIEGIIGDKNFLRYVGREATASTATGYAKVHAVEQKKLIEDAFGK